MPDLMKVYENTYSVYQKCQMYCFIPEHNEKQSLTLEESFLLGGRYVFADLTEKQELFFEKAAAFFRRRNRWIRFLWVENPQESGQTWRVHFLAWSRTGKLRAAESVIMERYRLVFSAGTVLRCGGAKFFFQDSGQSNCAFLGPDGRWDGEFYLDTDAGKCGAFCGKLKNMGNRMMERLDAGIGFFSISDDRNSRFQGFIHSAVNRVFTSETEEDMEVMITPHRLLEREYTWFSLKGRRFVSNFVTETGYSIEMEGTEDAALVFQRKPVRAHRTKEKDVCAAGMLYLGISGRFSGEEKERHLLCGLSETETVRRGEGSYLCFVPSMPAVEPYDDCAMGTTSWVGIEGISSYYCQSEAAALFADSKEGELRFLEIPEREFSEGMPAVPFLPYRGVCVHPEKLALEWEEGLYRRRRTILSEQKTVLLPEMIAKDSPNIRSVSSQGLMAQTTQDGGFEWIGFANVSQEKGLPDFRFCSVTKELRQHFMQKQFIYRIDSPEQLGRFAPSAGVDFSVDGIAFKLSPESWIVGKEDRNTMLLLKYSDRQSIRQALSGCEVFESCVRRAYTGEGTVKEGYEEFLKLIEEPGFQGILALNVCVSLEEMPDQVRILMKGIEPEEFCAAFLAVQTGKIQKDSVQGLCMEKAEVAALVDYTTERKLIYDSEPPEYDYLTREIKIVIDGGRISSFTSISELLVNRMFEAKSIAQNNPDGNCLVLFGKLVEEEGISKYQYRLKSAVEYELAGSGISRVSVESMDLTADGNGNGNGTFIINGRMQSREMEGADLLGFGEEGTGEGLSFSSLNIQKLEQGTLTMEYDRLVLDIRNIMWREGSFPDTFAVSLREFVTAEGSPESAGWQSVSAPVIQGIPPKNWQGFRWTISPGNQGAPTGGGLLGMELLTAFWSAKQGETEYYVGIRLPESLSGLTALQGMIQMGFGALSLEKGKQGYLIRLHNYNVRVMGLSFPPGSSDLFLISDGKSVGWYGAYAEKGE